MYSSYSTSSGAMSSKYLYASGIWSKNASYGRL
jgi:hypothetical protein